MSKEQTFAVRGACGQRITFMEQHIPHCFECRTALAAIKINNRSGDKAAKEFVAQVKRDLARRGNRPVAKKKH